MALFFEDYFNSVFGSTGIVFKKPINFKSNLVSGQAATATLTVAQSGSTILFDRAAGIVYTLPPPQVGLFYDFITTVAISSGAAEVDTDSASTFILGQVVNAVAAGTSTIFFADGTSNVKISSNGTTTGGLKGGSYRLTAVSSTVWECNGIVKGSGTIATPFA